MSTGNTISPFQRSPHIQSSTTEEDPNLRLKSRPATDTSRPLPPALRLNTLSSERRSTVSFGMGQRIQQHLEAGNPLYLGFDMRDNSRDSIGGKRSSEEDGQGPWVPESKQEKRWTRSFTCGLPLDVAVKIIFTVGLLLAWLQILAGTDSLIQKMVFSMKFSELLPSAQIVWGFIFGTSCIFGMLMMWGKWRRSPTIALFFTITWVLTTSFVLVVAVIWYYFFFSIRAKEIEGCKAKTVKIGAVWDWNPDVPRRGASEDQIAACISAVKTKGTSLLVPGIIYTLMVYCGCVVVAWGRVYRNRLLDIREWEEVQKAVSGGKESEKLGLVLGTAPLGTQRITTLGRAGESWKSSPASSDGTPSPVSPVTPEPGGLGVRPIRPGMVFSDRRPNTDSPRASRIVQEPMQQIGHPVSPEGRLSYAASDGTIARVL